jgi:hypothetical protein
MKKIFVLVVSAASLIACNNDGTDTTTTIKSDTASNSATAYSYTPAEGDVSYRNGKVVVWRDNDWVIADDDVTLDDGIVVRKNGEVRRGDDVIVLKDGEVVDRSGRFFDKAGNAIENGWDAAKKGVKKAGEEVKDVFTNDDNNKKNKDDKDK